MRKFYHFLPKPELPKMTPREIRIERLNFERDIGFMKVYALFLFSFISLAYIVQWITHDPLGDLHTEICAHVQNSPLCKSFDTLAMVDEVARKKNVPTRLVVWIWNAESTLGTHFNKDVCASYHNWAGLKGRKFDDGRVEMYAINRRKPDKNGCWLYKFESLKQATESLVNTLAIGYKACNHKTICIAYDFVGDPNIAEAGWIARVGKFYLP